MLIQTWHTTHRYILPNNFLPVVCVHYKYQLIFLWDPSASRHPTHTFACAINVAAVFAIVSRSFALSYFFSSCCSTRAIQFFHVIRTGRKTVFPDGFQVLPWIRNAFQVLVSGKLDKFEISLYSFFHRRIGTELSRIDVSVPGVYSSLVERLTEPPFHFVPHFNPK